MAEELGRIEKPEAGQFTGKRKLYLIPLIYTSDEAPKEYAEKFEHYWQQVDEQLTKLETKAGKASHIYHESVTLAGENGLKVIESLNPASHRIVQPKCQGDATLEATEDRELAEECMDWERCLIMGFISEKVARTVSESYIEVSKKRYQYIARRIDETLKEAEAGMLFIREGHMVQFPQDIEVFIVSPPAFDEIHRWQRERRASPAPEQADGSQPDS